MWFCVCECVCVCACVCMCLFVCVSVCVCICLLDRSFVYFHLFVCFFVYLLVSDCSCK